MSLSTLPANQLLLVKSTRNYSCDFHSLPNFSNDVRWSVDLRWQSPHHKWGFYDIAEGVLFRDRKQGDVNPDWKKFLSINRKEVWQRMHFDKVKVKVGVSLTTNVTP